MAKHTGNLISVLKTSGKQLFLLSKLLFTHFNSLWPIIEDNTLQETRFTKIEVKHEVN